MTIDSAKNQIVAPRIFAYHRPFSGEGWDRAKPQTPDTAREWVRFAAKKGVDGIKFGAHDPEIMAGEPPLHSVQPLFIDV